MPIFPANGSCAECGDLVFFFRKQNEFKEEKQEAISAVISSEFGDAFHVGIIVEPKNNDQGEQSEQIVHAAEEKVRVQPLADVVAEIQPGRVELCRVSAGDDPEWRRRATAWAIEQCGSGYNDLFSPECMNSKGQKAFYCCQLAVEAYKATNPLAPGSSPFLAHSLNFAGPDGEILPFWVEYYRNLCPQNPDPPQGRPGSHPSKLRASPCVELVACKNFEN